MPIFSFELTDEPTPPAPYNVAVATLAPGYAATVMKAVTEGFVDAVEVNGNWFVCRHELEDVAGPSSDTHDPQGGCFIPDHALVSAQ